MLLLDSSYHSILLLIAQLSIQNTYPSYHQTHLHKRKEQKQSGGEESKEEKEKERGTTVGCLFSRAVNFKNFTIS